MKFTEWYFKQHKEKWNGDFTQLVSFATGLNEGYTKWCKENNMNPIWDGEV